MIYQKYELSLSQNGSDIMHIARNVMGNVIFRESSEENLKKAIDKSIEVTQTLEDLEEKKKIAKAKAKNQKRGLFAPPPEPVDEVGEEESVLIPATTPQTRVTRGPDGKFISKSTLNAEEPKKRNLWEKLTS